MSTTDDLQERFDGALASLPPLVEPSSSGLHDRLRKRQFKRRIAVVVAAAATVTVGLSIGLTGTPSQPAGAVVLRVSDATHASPQELSADATVMRNRLAHFGDTRARVSVSGDTIVVTGAPSQLSDPSTPLTQSPSLLVRQVLCYSGSYNESSAIPVGSLPSSCGTYDIQPATPDGYPPGSGFTSEQDALNLDPALASFPSTTPAEDLANPGAVALLPVTPQEIVNQLPTYIDRYLVGPTELTLSSSVATAQAVRDQFGTWQVNVELGPNSAFQWNQVAKRYFHLILAVDLNGQIVDSSYIEPTQTTFTPFDELNLGGGFSQATAEAVAAALQSGPLPVPLQVSS
jgi:hypothetical protein